MYRVVVLTDDVSADGFRLAGVDVVVATDNDDARRILLDMLNDDTVGVVAANDAFVAALDERTQDKIDRLYRPIVVPIPSKQTVEVTDERRDYLAGLIRRAVGFDIKLGD